MRWGNDMLDDICRQCSSVLGFRGMEFGMLVRMALCCVPKPVWVRAGTLVSLVLSLVLAVHFSVHTCFEAPHTDVAW